MATAPTPKSPRSKMATSQCKVEIVEGRSLRALDAGGTSDPYVIITLGEAKQRTTTQYKTVAPVYGEHFIFDGSLTGHDVIHLDVFDENVVFADEVIGECNIDVSYSGANKRGDEWFQLIPSRLAKQSAHHFLGEIHVRWYYTNVGSLFSSVDRKEAVVDPRDVALLPEFNHKILESNLERIKEYVAATDRTVNYARNIVLWTNPLESLAWFYVFHTAASSEKLIQLIPLIGMLGMVRNFVHFRRYGFSTWRKDTEGPTAPTLTPPEVLQELMTHARIVQRETSWLLETLDYVHDCTNWVREEEALAIIVGLAALTFWGSVIWSVGFLLPPLWCFTTGVVWYVFLAFPIYANFPVLRRKYHWTNLTFELRHEFKGLTATLHYAYTNLRKGSLLKHKTSLYFKYLFAFRNANKKARAAMMKYNLSDTHLKLMNVSLRGTRRVHKTLIALPVYLHLTLKISPHPVVHASEVSAVDTTPDWRKNFMFPCATMGGEGTTCVLEIVAKRSHKILEEETLGTASLNVMVLARNQESEEMWVPLENERGEVVCEVGIVFLAWGFGVEDHDVQSMRRLQREMDGGTRTPHTYTPPRSPVHTLKLDPFLIPLGDPLPGESWSGETSEFRAYERFIDHGVNKTFRASNQGAYVPQVAQSPSATARGVPPSRIPGRSSGLRSLTPPASYPARVYKTPPPGWVPGRPSL